MQFSTRRTILNMKEHRANLDARLAKFARKPRDCGILWSVRVQVAESESEAPEKKRKYLDSIPPEAGAAGTPQQICDRLEQLNFETGSNEGFMLARGFSAPGNLQEFVDFVVPELQRRGLSKSKYTGRREGWVKTTLWAR